MTNTVHIDPDCGIVIDDQDAHIDVFGQVMLVGIFSDLCQLRDGEIAPNGAIALDRIAKRLGKLLERYEC